MLPFVTCLFSEALLPLTNGDPHRSAFKFQTAALSILCVTFLVWLSFVVNLLNAFLVWLPKFSLYFCVYSGGATYYPYCHIVHVPRFVITIIIDWTVRGSNPGGGEMFHNRSEQLWGPASFLYNAYWFFPGGKALTNHPSSRAEVNERV
jgi:hypothetical protein